MTDIRVIAVTLGARKAPLVVMATYTKSAFHIASVSDLPASPTALHVELQKIAESAEKHGALLVVEDPTGMFKSFGSSIRLDDKGEGNRPVLVAAMERYTALSSIGAITFPQGTDGQFSITNSIYNVNHSDNGRTSFEIDWERLKDGSRVMLLAIYAALCQTPYHQGYLSRFMSALGLEANIQADPFKALKEGIKPAESNNSESTRYIL